MRRRTEPKDEPLRRDIGRLGRLLGQVLVEQEGEDLLRTEEEIRLLCKKLRSGVDPELGGRLRGRIEGLDAGELRRIVRAFSVYFQLVNIAERYHRIRRRRQYEASPENLPQRASLTSALSRLEGEGGFEKSLLEDTFYRLALAHGELAGDHGRLQRLRQGRRLRDEQLNPLQGPAPPLLRPAQHRLGSTAVQQPPWCSCGRASRPSKRLTARRAPRPLSSGRRRGRWRPRS